jgi:tetratricopeptide (TPR) repeat protein
MHSRIRTFGVIVGGLLLAGFATRLLVEERVWSEVRKEQPGLQLENMEEAMGQGVILGLLGGFRALVANALWLRTNYSWEKLDLPQTQTLIRLTVTADPRPLYFWQNGARMIGYDMPNWRIDFAGGYDKVPEAVRRRFDEEQSAVALRMLGRALEYHPDHPLLYVEIANIHQRRLGDEETAARYYKLAADQPTAPYYAPRIYAELLRKLGRKQEAYDYLLKLLPTLPLNDSYAMAWVVHDRIRELEEEMGMPPEKRYPGARPEIPAN